MTGIPKIAVKTAPEPDLPLVFTADLVVEDWAQAALLSSGDVVARNRRRLLTIFLPMLWFFAILGSFAGWRPVRSPLTFSQFAEFMGRFIGDIPFYLMILISAGILFWWLIHPWRMQRLSVRLLRAAGFDRPIPLTYRVAAEGLTTTEAQRESFTPWSRFDRMEERRDHFFLVLPAQEETIALPKRAIPADQIDVLRDWLKDRIGAPQEPAPPRKPPAEALRFEVTLEPQDRAAAILWYQGLPTVRRARRLGILRNWLLASLVVPLLAILAWTLDPERLPMSLALPIFWALFPSLFWKPALLFGALAALRLVFDGKLMRWFASHTGEVLQDRASRHPMRFTIDDTGILTEEAGGHTRIDWSGVTGVERPAGHWLVRISRGSTLILPRRMLEPAQGERLEALFSRHIQRA